MSGCDGSSWRGHVKLANVQPKKKQFEKWPPSSLEFKKFEKKSSKQTVTRPFPSLQLVGFINQHPSPVTYGWKY